MNFENYKGILRTFLTGLCSVVLLLGVIKVTDFLNVSSLLAGKSLVALGITFSVAAVVTIMEESVTEDIVKIVVFSMVLGLGWRSELFRLLLFGGLIGACSGAVSNFIRYYHSRTY